MDKRHGQQIAHAPLITRAPSCVPASTCLFRVKTSYTAESTSGSWKTASAPETSHS